MTDDAMFKPGDPPPVGYVDWHEWAQAQMRAGLRARQCRHCKLYHFPQEQHDCIAALRAVEARA